MQDATELDAIEVENLGRRRPEARRHGEGG
jgi:hypothetical protein